MSGWKKSSGGCKCNGVWDHCVYTLNPKHRKILSVFYWAWWTDLYFWVFLCAGKQTQKRLYCAASTEQLICQRPLTVSPPFHRWPSEDCRQDMTCSNGHYPSQTCAKKPRTDFVHTQRETLCLSRSLFLLLTHTERERLPVNRHANRHRAFAHAHSYEDLIPCTLWLSCCYPAFTVNK